MNFTQDSATTKKLNPYPEYKDSGVEWLGEVPEHWDIVKIRHLAQVKRGASPRPIDDPQYFNEDGEYAWVKISDVTASDMYLLNTEQTLSELGKSKSVPLEPGSLILSIAATVGEPIITKIKCCIHDGFVYFENLKQNPKFLYYVLSTDEPYKGLGKLGTQLNLNTNTVGDIMVPVPSQNSQRIIVRFLDHMTKKIDKLISRNERLIKLLEEKRKALVHEAIQKTDTRNLRLKFVADQIFRPVDCKDDQLYTPIGVYNRGRGIFHKEPTQGSKLGDSDFFWVKSGDLVISGQFAWEGAVALATDEDEDCIVSHRYPILRGKSDILDSVYLWAFFTTKTGDFLLNEHSRGAAGRNRPLNTSKLLKEKIPVPPMDAQLRVSEHVSLERQFKRNITDFIELLKEYRQSLITTTVTGQIDVSDWEPPAEEAEVSV